LLSTRVGNAKANAQSSQQVNSSKNRKQFFRKNLRTKSSTKLRKMEGKKYVIRMIREVPKFSTFTAILLIVASSAKGCIIVTPSTSLVSNKVDANLSISFFSFLHLAKVPIPSSLCREMGQKEQSRNKESRFRLYGPRETVLSQ